MGLSTGRITPAVQTATPRKEYLFTALNRFWMVAVRNRVHERSQTLWLMVSRGDRLPR
jgi:hypothetical protein